MSHPLLLGNSVRNGEEILIPSDRLLRHVMAVGSSGSGKTVLCKVLIEELIHSSVPVICIDPQGDLASLALPERRPEILKKHGIDLQWAAELFEKVNPVVYTPASSKGAHLTADPFPLPTDVLDDEEELRAYASVARSIATLAGYDPSNEEGEGVISFLESLLPEKACVYKSMGRMTAEATQVLAAEDDGEWENHGHLMSGSIVKVARKLARMGTGARKLMFTGGNPINIDDMLGKRKDGRVNLNIIYMNTLSDQADKEFFLSVLVEKLITWMMANPSKELQGAFYIDEVAPYIPPVSKPACKPALQTLFKQARKYGIGCLMATQNPGDVDYKAMAQFGTWAIGRLTTRQDLKKVSHIVKSLSPEQADRIMALLPKQDVGEFIVMSPPKVVAMKTRWLCTKHETLDEDQISKMKNTEVPEPKPEARSVTPSWDVSTRSKAETPRPKAPEKKSSELTMDKVMSNLQKRSDEQTDYKKKYYEASRKIAEAQAAASVALIITENVFKEAGIPPEKHLKKIRDKVNAWKREKPAQTQTSDDSAKLAELQSEHQALKKKYDRALEKLGSQRSTR